MAVKKQISRAKGVEICIDLLYTGKNRKEILQYFTNTYKLSDSTIDKWMKAAMPAVKERQQQAEALRVKETDAATIEALKQGLKSDLELESFLCQLAMGNVVMSETVQGAIILRDVTPAERIRAIDLIYKKRGSCAPAKADLNISGGITLIEKETNPIDDPID